MPRVARPQAPAGPRPVPPRPAARRPRIGPAAWVALALAAGTLALFAPVYRAGFVNYDDPDYVTANLHVHGGLTGPNVAWAFTTTHAANWHPLAWLSLQLDATVFGPESAAGFHLTNVVLHAASAVLLFLALRRMTGALGPPALVAALFAAHPMHVESVAWVAERKDVLSGLFWMLVLLAYARYAERPTGGRYLAVLGAFAVGLTAKPMLVTLPCVLLLLDYWPLGRSGPARLVREKVPLFALAAVAAAATVYAQQAGGAVRSFAAVPVDERVANALTAYVRYLAMAVVPIDQAVFYPHPAHTPLWQAAGAALLLAAVTSVAVRVRRRAPYLVVGWLWFLGTLVPVIGLVQVGAQAMADRYTYLPYIGLFVAAAWGGSALGAGRPRLAWAAGVAAVGACALGTLGRLPVWHDSLALWEDARRATGPSAVAENNLGTALEAAGRLDEAWEHYAAAVRLDPRHLEARYNLGTALFRRGDTAGAAEQFEAALGINPDHSMVLINYGLLLQRLAQPDRAAELFRRAGDALTAMDDPEAAAASYRLADEQARVAENPWYRHWAGFEPGTAAVRAVTTAAGPGGLPARATETTRLVEKGAYEIVLEVETTGGPLPIRTRQPIPRAVGLPPGVRREDFGTRPAGAIEEGTEAVTAGGVEYRAVRYRVRAGGDAETTLWMADGVPGKVVRSETRTADGRVVRTVELVRVTRPGP